ncbi:MAG TPA: hypothetical protein EYH09_02115 [Candidatus Nanopusillus sp.]|nr:hypothetical protein [Candidatus Nanopusillus sp.]
MGSTFPDLNNRGGPTKTSSDEIKTDISKRSIQDSSQDIDINKSKTEPSTQISSQQVMMELPNPLKESLGKIYQGLEGMAKYIVGVERKADEGLQRIGGLEERMEKVEEEFNDFKKFVEEKFDKVDNRLDYVGKALDTLADAIRKIPVTYNKLVKVEPDSTEGAPFETEDGEIKWYKIVTVHNEAGNYKPIKSILNKFEDYRKKV